MTDPVLPVGDGAALAPAAEPRLREAIRESLRGTPRDYTRGAVGRAVILLAVPMILEMAMESIFAITDIFFVGRLGASAVATVGLTEALLTIVYTVAMGLGIGATATVARRIGEGDEQGASDATAQGLLLGLVVAAVLGTIGVAFGPRLLALMGAGPDILAAGSGYVRLMLGGSVTVLFLFLINAAFRGAGDAVIAMRVLWFANAINIVLGPVLIFGLGPFPRLGVTGAALATTVGRGTGALFALTRLFSGTGRLHVRPRMLRPKPAVMERLTRLSAAATVQLLVATASWIGLVRIVSRSGSDALAGYTIGIRIVIFALLPSAGLANAAATMVGQALGARDPARAEAAVWRAGWYNLLFLGGTGVLFVIAARPIVGIFAPDPVTARYAAACLRIVALGFPLYAYGMVLEQAFNGAGDTRTPTILNLFIFWLWEIPLAFVLAGPQGLGPYGVFVSIAVAFCTLALASAVLFRRGRWRTRTV